jgi:hypothetical protein
MLHRICECEVIAPGILQPVAQGNQFLPTVDRNQPAVFQTPLKLFGFDAQVDHVRICPNEWMKRLNVRYRRTVLFPAINLHRPGLAKLDCNDAWGWISAKEQRVFLEFH